MLRLVLTVSALLWTCPALPFSAVPDLVYLYSDPAQHPLLRAINLLALLLELIYMLLSHPVAHIMYCKFE
jgi:hypothetical protein